MSSAMSSFMLSCANCCMFCWIACGFICLPMVVMALVVPFIALAIVMLDCTAVVW